MAIDTLMNGADAYTTLAEVSDSHHTQAPEASPSSAPCLVVSPPLVSASVLQTLSISC